MLRAPQSLLLFGAAYITMFLLGYCALLVAPSEPLIPADVFNSILLPNTVGVSPEPRDMFLYLATLAFVPLVLASLAAIATKLKGVSNASSSILLAVMLIAATNLILLGIIPQILRSISILGLVVAALSIAITSIIVSFDLKDLRKFLPWASLGLFLVASVLVLLQRVWTEASLTYSGPLSSHYEAVTSSVVRIATGGTCLVDVIAQYGCYGEFVAPLLRIFGRDITTITIIFSVLLIAAIGAVIRFSTILITHPILSIGCSLCVVMAAAFNLVYYVNDPVLQYFPLRFLFPAISLILAAWFQSAPDNSKAMALGLFAGAAVTWNLESGLVVLISLGTFIAMINLTTRSRTQSSNGKAIIYNTAVYMLGTFLFLSLFTAYLSLKSGSTIDLKNYVIFQQVFSMTGFGMIPIPAPPSLWLIHASLLFATLAYCTLQICSRNQRDRRLELAAYVAVLGIGLVAYYVGRSHPLVLRLVIWPSIFLFFFLLDRTFQSAKTRSTGITSSLAIIVSTALPLMFFTLSIPSVIEVTRKARNAPIQENSAIIDDIQFIKARTIPGERVAILAIDQGVLYGHSGTRAAIEGPGVAEMIRRVDLERQIEAMVDHGPDKVFLGTNLGEAAQAGLLGTSIHVDMDRLGKAYRIVETAPGGRLLFLRRRS